MSGHISRGDMIMNSSGTWPGSNGTSRHEENIDPPATADELRGCTTPQDRGEVATDLISRRRTPSHIG